MMSSDLQELIKIITKIGWHQYKQRHKKSYCFYYAG